MLRRRRVLSLDADVWEVTLDGAFLMSSLVDASEVALAELGLAALGAPPAGGHHVVVGGLGLGHTAAAALRAPGVGSVLVVEALAEVVGWHERGLVPAAERLLGDPRCRFVQADFFALARDPERGFDPDAHGRRVHAVLLDVDHSPAGLLHPSHADLYTPEGLARLRAHLHPGGVFALWSSEPPEQALTARLASAFAHAEAHPVAFHNPLLDRDDLNTVYVARAAG